MVTIEYGQLILLKTTILDALAENVLEASETPSSGACPLAFLDVAPALGEGTLLLLVRDVMLGVDVDLGSPEFAFWEVLL